MPTSRRAPRDTAILTSPPSRDGSSSSRAVTTWRCGAKSNGLKAPHSADRGLPDGLFSLTVDGDAIHEHKGKTPCHDAQLAVVIARPHSMTSTSRTNNTLAVWEMDRRHQVSEFHVIDSIILHHFLTHMCRLISFILIHHGKPKQLQSTQPDLCHAIQHSNMKTVPCLDASLSKAQVFANLQESGKIYLLNLLSSLSSV